MRSTNQVGRQRSTLKHQEGVSYHFQARQGRYLTTTQMFNGNISAMQWSKGNGGSVGRQAYSFQYDPMNRLTTASHFDHDVSWQSYNRSYQEKINSYDLNGNILNLSRRGFGGALMDTLRYFYSGNRLSYVHDNGNATEGFVNANTGTDDYDYDFNGNLDKDKNKGISTKGNIKYNYLNLPKEIIKGTESIKYIYDASGRKLRQEVYSNNGGTLVKYTDYIGELVYEGGNLQFIQHAEGRVLPDGANWEYQYHLKDHLGNVRVTFTAKPQTPVNYTANLENGNGSSGEGVFGNYTSTTFDLVDHTDPGTTYQRVQWLNGGASGRVGLTKSLSVMPGDRVSVIAYAKYRNLTGTGNTNPFAAALTAAFGVSSGSTGEQLKLYNGLNAYGVSVAGGNHPADDDTAPKAFVTILLFDKNYNLLDAAWDQVTTTLEQVSATNKEAFDHALAEEVIVAEGGYAYIFVSNEHPTYVDVYFDDVTVGHTLSPIVSSSDYYPFGLTFNSFQRENSVAQRWKFQGQEHIDDLGLNWDAFKWRNHQPDIGRFFSIDPLADEYTYNSPYAFSENKVVAHVELEGLESVPFNARVTRVARYGGNPARLRSAASEAARIANRPTGFVGLTPRETTYFRRTTRYSLSRGVGSTSNESNNYGKTQNAGDESNPDNTHNFGNRGGNGLKAALDLADQARSLMSGATEISVVKSFSEPGFFLGSDIVIGNREMNGQLNALNDAFNTAVLGAAMGDMSQDQWSNLTPAERLLRLSRAYVSAGPSPREMARQKAKETEDNLAGTTETSTVPLIKPQEWQLHY